MAVIIVLWIGLLQYFKSTLQKDTGFSPTALTACKHNINCYRRNIAAILDAGVSAEEILVWLKKNEKDGNLYGICHQLAHEIGRRVGRNSEQPHYIHQYLDLCDYGFLHGFAEGLLNLISIHGASGPKPSDAAMMGSGICKSLNISNIETIRCYHGLGHGFFSLYNGDPALAITACKKTSPYKVSTCISGVFMEDVWQNWKTRVAEQKNPLFPCTIVDEKFKEECYYTRADYFNKIANGDPIVITRSSLTVPFAFQQQCFGGSGRLWITSNPDMDITIKNCNLATPLLREYCLQGAEDILSMMTADQSINEKAVKKFRELVNSK